MEILKRTLLRPFYKRYQGLLTRLEDLESRHLGAMSRIGALELACQVMVDSPRYVGSVEEGFNGQAHRKRIVQDLVSRFRFEIMVETGTFVGNTTGYLASTTHATIYTCEVNPVFHALALSRLAGIPNIHFHLGDSREFLKSLGETLFLREDASKPIFFYLDAHWNQDLPLDEELQIISSQWRECVAMIDDFHVPDDDGYGFDNYGKMKTLDLATFGQCFAENELAPFFPCSPSEKENGARRGCVVLGKGSAVCDALESIQSLRSWPR